VGCQRLFERLSKSAAVRIAEKKLGKGTGSGAENDRVQGTKNIRQTGSVRCSDRKGRPEIDSDGYAWSWQRLYRSLSRLANPGGGRDFRVDWSEQKREEGPKKRE
jgi:hypothetical protein